MSLHTDVSRAGRVVQDIPNALRSRASFNAGVGVQNGDGGGGPKMRGWVAGRSVPLGGKVRGQGHI